MPAHVWNGSAWVETVAFKYDGAEFTDNTDNGWVWDGAEWVQFQPEFIGGDLTLLPVENMVASEITANHALVEWDLPVQPDQDPNEVWIQIPEIAGIWMIYDYPVSSWEHNALMFSTSYQVMVKLVLRELGEVVAESPTRSVFLTTTAPTVPTLPDAPDPGDPDPPPWPIVVIPDPPPGCDLDLWELEEGTAGNVVDSGTDFTVDPETGTYVDLTAYVFLADTLYRICTTDTCDNHVCGAWFQVECGAPAILGDAPFDDAIVYVPGICENQIIEAVSDTAGHKGPAFGGFGLTDDNLYTVTSAGEGLVGYGLAPNVAGTHDGDFSITWLINAGATPVASQLRGARCGGLAIELTEDSGKIRPIARCARADGADTTITNGSTELNLDEDQIITLTHDVSAGELLLYVGASVVASATLVGLAQGRRVFIDLWELYLPADALATRFAAWDRVLSAAEIALLNPEAPIFINVHATIGTSPATSSELGNGDDITQAMILAVGVRTRTGSVPGAGVPVSTVDGYAAGTSGYDSHGGAAGITSPGITFGTRSQMEYRQDWLNFAGGDQYRVTAPQVDDNQAYAFYRMAYPWKVRQVAHGATATTALSASFALPVASGSRIVIAIGCLEANSVSVAPANASLDGTAGSITNRTARITAYRSAAYTGLTTVSATMASTTGGSAMTIIEVARTDTLDLAMSEMIRSKANLLAYWPLNHSLSTIEKNYEGSLGVFNIGTLTQLTLMATAGEDGRSYPSHASGSPAIIPDNANFTPHASGGVTWGFLLRPTTLTGNHSILAKHASTASAREWEIYITATGALGARTFTSAGATARQRETAGVLTTGVWYLVYVRFGETSTDYPLVRVSALNLGTASGSGTAQSDQTTTVQLGALNSGSNGNAYIGSIAHIHVLEGWDIEDDIEDIEDAARSDGWPIDGPTVTINQAAGQASPTDTAPIEFDIVFSESVSGFTSADITLGGTASPADVAISGSGATYTATVSGMLRSGTVTATIAAGVCRATANGQLNQASTSSDNEVTYEDVVYDAIMAISPTRYYPCREATGTVMNEELGGTDGTWQGNISHSRLGPDLGHVADYQEIQSSSASIPDDDLFSPQTAGGLNITFLMQLDGLDIQRVYLSKRQSVIEWQIREGTSDGSIIEAVTYTSSDTVARQRSTPASTVATGNWYRVFVYFGASATAFPTVRVNGGTSGTNSGAGTARGNSTAVANVGASSTTATAIDGMMVHLAYKSGAEWSNADKASIEAADQAQGWY